MSDLVPGYLRRWEQVLVVPLEWIMRDTSHQPHTEGTCGVPVPAAPVEAALLVFSFSQRGREKDEGCTEKNRTLPRHFPRNLSLTPAMCPAKLLWVMASFCASWRFPDSVET